MSVQPDAMSPGNSAASLLEPDDAASVDRGAWNPQLMSLRSMWKDTLWALAGAIIAALLVSVGSLSPVWLTPETMLGARIFSFAIVIPLMVRRRYPLISAGSVMAIALLQVAAGFPWLLPASLAVFVALYSVTIYGPRWAAGVALAAVLLGAIVITWGISEYQAEPSLGALLTIAGLVASLGFATWSIALFRRSHRESIWALKARATAMVERNIALAERNTALAAERRALESQAQALAERNAALQSRAEALDDRAVMLELRARKAEAEKEQEARLAATAERIRIAREMHDIIGHALSGMVFLANSAEYAAQATGDANAAASSLHTISQTGTDALATMRQLLQVLRDDDGQWRDAEVGTPTPGTIGTTTDPNDPYGWHHLLEENRHLGMNLTVTETGTPHQLTPPAANALYRITQEALTNVRKHANPTARVNVALTWTPTGLTLSITDDAADPTRRSSASLVPVVEPVETTNQGATVATPAELATVVEDPANLAANTPSGQGLIGMRERAALAGGTLVANSTPTGWQVTFTLNNPASPNNSGT